MSQSPQGPEQPGTVQRTDRRGQPVSAPASHTVLVQAAGDEAGGLLVSHLLCSAPPAYVPAMPNMFNDGTAAAVGVLMSDLIQAVVAHGCPPDAPNQTAGSLL